MDTLSIRAARRLALARAGLLTPEQTGLPRRARGRGPSAFAAAQEVIRRFGYLQLDTVSVAGARSHTIVLLSRLEGLDAPVGEELLRPGAPIFEYWGHEASWIPHSLYPALDFRRREFRSHPWWGDLVREHPKVAAELRRRIREDGPLRSADMEGRGSKGWWDLGIMKRVASALWSSGELAIRERRNFQRTYDLAERVIPEELRRRPLSTADGLEALLLTALDGHGWATTGTLAATWRLKNRKAELLATLRRLQEKGAVLPCALEAAKPPDGGRSAREGSPTTGWIRPEHRALAARVECARPRADTGVLLSPFDPLLWDRGRVARLFGFDALLEIFKPAPQRVYGYYCLPVLAGEHLVARVDLKADRKKGSLRVVSAHYEKARADVARRDREAARIAVARYASALGLRPAW
ncbi:MAG TPA: crosslink repair DNA glycosylase YcaQ family protein [Vicinamibacteria bacterium]|nr:crosslink repair DNA glycosylase YcaQ family protein [Vicinamibacteria bacterium]